MATEYLPSHEDPSGVTGIGQGPQVVSTSGVLDVIMGPLLNYRRTSNQQTGQPVWHGSVLIVTTPGQQDANAVYSNPQLVLSPAGAVDRSIGHVRFSVAERTFHGQKLYEDSKKAFWRFIIEAPMQPFESRWSYDIQGLKYVEGSKEEKPQVFVIPSISQSMRIMFHSCNGFSVGTDMDIWQGPVLWNDVLRMHEQRPFHVMIGGGDQIYNDGVRVDGPLKPWTDIGNPHKRREYPFDRKMRDECDEYYYNNYIRWYGHKPFSTANSQIPQVNIWDDHDIIDGFGSYTDHFMNCAVFRGIGRVAHNANPELKHMILLLGVPIAYPRLIWLENILQSPLIAPIKFLNKRFGFAGGFFNQFDGKVDLLDDLDDHYTARQHKQERRDLMHRLQRFSQKFSARVTILGGDVHLGAIGRFYSNPKAGLRAEEDWRYMPNIISSAITNKPPPQAVANLLARRNKIHHLDKETDETLLEIFDRDPALPDGVNASNGTNGAAINGDGKDGKIEPKTSAKNHATMPSRNYAIICESVVPPSATLSAPGAAPGQAPSINTNGDAKSTLSEAPGPKDNMRQPFHLGEQSAGTQHPAAGGIQPTGLCGPYGLDVSLRVEISNKDREGRTDGYGFTIPALQVSDALRQKGVNW
ncbi:conserved hypothetical protein [Pyrenophora tritici-repentis Pt-1C-BFP]|uniref:PhoD-like phosphatase domain-containing protein n=1 Tax=Pyrenophora tritici-repentis (strain Pt-1C-BFP) TaxID=426418 RepID=B2WGD2_PYRTR|nr:uncharacterized protein PTRG_08988 [Pyrenophora tritici-repentis Pt-1C-BFP]EDU42039.1 conserved hypothetical protein [Pyrenophora tritici-repentis Pt-1C-BFP]